MQEEQHRGPPRPWVDLISEWVEARTVKVTLAVLVIISLLPLDVAIDTKVRPLFLMAFGSELVARAFLWRKGRRPATSVSIAFLVADVLGFVSFLPLEGLFGPGSMQLLGLLRLTRLFMLLRFSRELAKDIYAILTRREQLQTLGLITGAVLVLSFVSAVILSQLAISHGSGHENVHFLERLWWSFRQLESPDNLVPSLDVNPVVALLSLCLTITGVFMISFVIGVGSNVVEQVVRAERRRPLVYRGHTVIVGDVHGGEDLIREFVLIYAKNRQIPSPERFTAWFRYVGPFAARAFPRVALLSRKDDPPDFLVDPIMRWVVYRQGDESDPHSLERVAAGDAKRALILSRAELHHEADAVAVSSLAALRQKNVAAHVYVEVREEATCDIVRQVGGPHTVALDVPRYLGMFLCQHLITPGVEGVYRDLLTSAGAEIYTHVYVDESDHQAIAALPPALSFEELSWLAQEFGVIVIGVYLGPEPMHKNPIGVIPVEGLVCWLNPQDDVDDDRVTALGGARGQIPTASLRGVIGVAESYLPLREFAAALASHRRPSPAAVARLPPPAALDELSQEVLPPAPSPKRVALIGYSDSLPSFLHELAQFVPGVDVTLFLSSRGDESTPLSRRLEYLRVGFDVRDPPPGADGRCVPLQRGGRLTVHTHDAPDLSSFAVRLLAGQAACEAVVFLSEPEGLDRDARTALRVLRFARLLEDGKVPHGETLHLLAEFLSIDKGAYIQRHIDARRCGFADESGMRLTLVSTETIKSYFMVHSAFVPGVHEVYGRLLEEAGQDLLRFRFRPRGPGTVTLGELAAALAPRSVLPIALELDDRQVLLSPGPDMRIDKERLRAVYAIAEGARLQ